MTNKLYYLSIEDEDDTDMSYFVVAASPEEAINLYMAEFVGDYDTLNALAPGFVPRIEGYPDDSTVYDLRVFEVQPNLERTGVMIWWTHMINAPSGAAVYLGRARRTTDPA